MNNYCKIIFGIFAFFILYSLFLTPETWAAELFFEPKTQEIKAGDYFQVGLFLDAQDEEINAIEGKIILPQDLLKVKEILEGDSIVSLWIEKPFLKDNEIIFSGIIPSGFKGILSPYYVGYKPGKILSLILESKINGEGLVTLKDTRVLLNDDIGTPTKFNISPFQFKITSEAPPTKGIIPIKDSDPPEPFKLTIAQDPNVFEEKWFLVFATSDKGSGVDHYEVLESRNQEVENKNWEITESPYLLKDQKLKSYIYIKAIDKAGNEKVAELAPQNPLKWYENYLTWLIIIIGVFLGYIIWRTLWRKLCA